jgi:importin subunit beta-1
MPALEDIWQKLDPANKPDIRNKVLGTLADPERNLRTAASMAVAAIAEFDIPTNQWPDLLQILINNAASTDKNIKLASLQTLGYICEVIAPNAVSPENSA